MSAVLRFNVAGTSFRKDQLDQVYKHYLACKVLFHPVDVILELEPDNKYDPNAVKVCLFQVSGIIHFGYVPKDTTETVREWMHKHPKHTIRIAYMGDNHTGTGNIGCIVELKETGTSKRSPPVEDEDLYPTSPEDDAYDAYEDLSDLGDHD